MILSILFAVPENHPHELSTNGSVEIAPNHHPLHSSHTGIPDGLHVNSSHKNLSESSGKADGTSEHEKHAPNKHVAEHVLHVASLTILAIFLVEVRTRRPSALWGTVTIQTPSTVTPRECYQRYLALSLSLNSPQEMAAIKC